MTKNMVPTAMCMELENVPIVSTSVIVTESTASVVAMEMKHKMKRKLGITNSLEVEPKPSTSTSVEVFVYSHTRKRKSTVGENHLTGQKDEKLLQHLKTATDSLKILAKTSINVCYIRQIRVKLFE